MSGEVKKYVWAEGSVAYAVYATLLEEKDGFLTLKKQDGHILQINRAFLVKIEDGRRP